MSTKQKSELRKNSPNYGVSYLCGRIKLRFAQYTY